MLLNSQGKMMIGVDACRGLHGTCEVLLDKDVNKDILLKALDETLKVYPTARSYYILKDGEVYLLENEKPVVLLNQDNGVVPGSDKLNNYLFYVNYKDNRITVGFSHVLSDGRGLFDFTKTLIYYYCCFIDNKMYEPNDVRVNKDDTFDQVDFWRLSYDDVKEVKEPILPKTGFVVPANKDRSKQPNMLYEIVVESNEFMKLVKDNGANPSLMTYVLFTKAIYNLYQNEDKPVIGRITMDVRKVLGIPYTFLNCSFAMHFSLNKEDVLDDNLKTLCPKLKEDMKYQASSDFQKKIIKDLIKEKTVFHGIKPSVSISYMGRQSFGEYSDHIKSFMVLEGECHKINFFEFNNHFHFIFHFGSNTEEYAKEFAKVLNALGCKASIERKEEIENEEDWIQG